ncbi:MAG TPA: protein translocase subunit SecD [Chloroflexi bacterium]|nr:protein translocase subunit SecD [Chloroflexota bacterium]
MYRRNLLLLGGIIILAAVAIWVDLPTNPGIHIHLGPIQIDREIEVHQGLDLQGGMQVLLEADVPPDEPVDRQAVAAAKAIIEKRVDGLGVSEPLIQLQGTRRIIVELPGLKNPEEAIAAFGKTGLLEFIHAGKIYLPPGSLVQTTEEVAGSSLEATPTATVEATPTLTATPSEADTEPLAPTPLPQERVFETIMTGRNLKSANLTVDDYNQIQITFTLDEEGARTFADYTAENVGQVMCIVLDKEVVSCATIKDVISRGEVLLTREGGFTPAEAESIVIRLRYGALPIPLRVESHREVGPTLGEDSIRKSTLAGAIGLSIVIAFMLIYYRLPGLLADLALVIYAAVVFAFFKLIPVVLTLAGITGFILSVGMAVDANILIFERLKEELRAGKGLRLAVEQGFSRAWFSIRDSNFSTLITCAILFWLGSYFGTSIIKGFAVTLAIGVLVSMFTAITVTHTLLRLVMDLDIAKTRWWFGV